MPDVATRTPLEPLLTFEEARALLRISKVTLHKLVREQRIQSVRVTDRRLFEREALEDFIAARREGGAE